MYWIYVCLKVDTYGRQLGCLVAFRVFFASCGYVMLSKESYLCPINLHQVSMKRHPKYKPILSLNLNAHPTTTMISVPFPQHQINCAPLSTFHSQSVSQSRNSESSCHDHKLLNIS